MADILIDDDLTMRQQGAISALLSEPTIRKASQASGVPERTIYTWLADPAFDAVYRAARREAVRQAIAQLQRHSSDAVRVLVEIMKGPRRTAAVRIAAASKVLDLAIKSVELEDLMTRIEALEQACAQRDKKP